MKRIQACEKSNNHDSAVHPQLDQMTENTDK